ncbi:hypothetical protein A3J15_01255 [Candidatus Roizmanbacteria bacterium RIFCSPLOWO2_02_FULL_38_10]|uniref:Methyltransferase domain-containing protein n=1 Tax=Candidatus Roizmanbacteria bacterium RIFCSPLOWO2_02_FULL_38_10 TaxID=1802074 RepID=A0A1F7JLD5_9BACT|nr:MAG: hypothetical protein A3J15_01255 [Candidatus Roizmanbacteria bacterium RIFCSPLOWO2_02_FULL_38_10]
MKNLIKDIKVLYKLYHPASFSLKIYICLRLLVANFNVLISYLPESGKVLDLGCGYGLLSNLIAEKKKKILVYGVDIDKKRINFAKSSIKQRKNIKFNVSDLNKIQSFNSCRCIIMFDLLHHLPDLTQQQLIKSASTILEAKGILLIKEIDKKPRWKYFVNYIHDKLANGGELFFRSSAQWMKFMENEGFKVQYRTYGVIYPHVLLIGVKK